MRGSSDGIDRRESGRTIGRRGWRMMGERVEERPPFILSSDARIVDGCRERERERGSRWIVCMLPRAEYLTSDRKESVATDKKLHWRSMTSLQPVQHRRTVDQDLELSDSPAKDQDSGLGVEKPKEARENALFSFALRPPQPCRSTRWDQRARCRTMGQSKMHTGLDLQEGNRCREGSSEGRA